jgi:hypothetical protein
MAKKQVEFFDCPMCKTRVRRKRAWAKYCSSRCSQKALRLRRVGHSGGVVARHAKPPPKVACNAPFSPASAGISEQGFPPLEAAETIDLAMRRLRPEQMLLGRWEYEYEVRLGDELLVVSRDPEHSACRALLAKGITGKARFMRDGKPSLIMDIEKAAQYRVQDKGRHGPRFVKYKQANQFSADTLNG